MWNSTLLIAAEATMAKPAIVSPSLSNGEHEGNACGSVWSFKLLRVPREFRPSG